MSAEPGDVREACEQAVLASARANDERDWTALAGLYAADGRLTRPSGQTIEGRDAIEASYRSGPPDRRTRHVCTNVHVVPDGDDAADATTTVLLFAWVDDPDAEGLPATTPILGEFEDRLVRIDGRWVIARRVARLLARVASD